MGVVKLLDKAQAGLSVGGERTTVVIDEDATSGLALPQGDDEEEDAIQCLADVRECADGSFSSRTPPSCAFAQCPDDDNVSDAGQRVGVVLPALFVARVGLAMVGGA